MDRAELRQIAAACGLGKLDDGHLDQLAQGIRTTRELAGRLPKDLHWTEESALSFNLARKGGRR